MANPRTVSMSSSPPYPFPSREQPDSEPTAYSPYGKDDDHKRDHDGNVANPTAASPELPKVWSIEDPFQFAPPKPDGDPWMLLLEPLLKNDQKRCDSWRDEVQNLLIFAGLFSSVVTSFIIQSYQGLQEDPNTTMITLLSHIAARLDAPLAPSTNITTPSSSISMPSFSPSTSSVRVNALWFTSLVLSLTTVLVGTISLQWLREHQTYSDLTPREIYAVFHMRHQSLARWHVDKIFSTMPLLLQCALVLFLIGIFDFLRTIGQWAVTTPVTIFMALTLFFLVATAVLPSVHTLALYFNFSDEWNRAGSRGRGQGKRDYPKAPSPCPYKSPQSHAIRTIVGPLFTLFDHLYPRLRKSLYRTRKIVRKARRVAVKKWSRPKSDVVEEGKKEVVEGVDDDDDESLPSETFTRYLLYASWKTRWSDFDVGWLAIRDGFMRRAYGRGAWFECIGSEDDEIAPVLDVVLGLSVQNYRQATSGAAYACFAEISEETLRPLRSRDRSYGYTFENDDVQKRFPQSAYLHEVLELASGLTDVFSMEEVLRWTSPDTDSSMDLRKNMETLHAVLHQQNLYAFMVSHYLSDGTLSSNHRKELSLRLSAYLYKSKIPLRPDIDTTQPFANVRFPSCLKFTPFETLLEPEAEKDAFNVITWQTANLMLSIFQILDSNAPGGQYRPDVPLRPTSVLLNPLIQRTGIPAFVQGASYFTAQSIRFATYSQHEGEPSDTFQRGILAKFDETFKFVVDSLQREIMSWPTAQGSGPSLLFYVAALYTNMLLSFAVWWERDGRFEEMVDVLCKYKRRTVDMGVIDWALEERLGEDQTKWWGTKKPFSEMWWEQFENTAKRLGERGAGDHGSEGGGDDGSVRFGVDHGRREDDIVVFYPFDSPQNVAYLYNV